MMTRFKEIKKYIPTTLSAVPYMLPQMAHAAGFDGLGSQLWCGLQSFTQSPIVAFTAGIALVVLLVVMVLNEGNGLISWGLKIGVAICGILSIGTLVNMLGIDKFGSCGMG